MYLLWETLPEYNSMEFISIHETSEAARKYAENLGLSESSIKISWVQKVDKLGE